jgi:predicted RNA binding protein YcfA (HicA-like mRNA interferase family)
MVSLELRWVGATLDPTYALPEAWAMAKPSKVFDRVMEREGTISFLDFERLLLALGFKHDRTSGSHRIYVHPRATRPLSVQPRGKDAKPYQVRQLHAMIEEFGLKL